MVSDADVLSGVDAATSGGLVGALMRAAGRPQGARMTAAEAVPRPPLAVGPETTIAETARLMTETRHKLVCVVDPDRRLLGIVDRADLLRAAGDALRELAATSRRGDDDDD